MYCCTPIHSFTPWSISCRLYNLSFIPFHTFYQQVSCYPWHLEMFLVALRLLPAAQNKTPMVLAVIIGPFLIESSMFSLQSKLLIYFWGFFTITSKAYNVALVGCIGCCFFLANSLFETWKDICYLKKKRTQTPVARAATIPMP